MPEPIPNPEAPDGAWRCAHAQFRHFVAAPDFPCTGAKSALNTGRYHFALFDELGTPDAVQGACDGLYRFIEAFPEPGLAPVTFVAAFAAAATSEAVFESLLWSQLQGMHRVDRARHDWDTAVAADPEDPNFALSIGGHGFFVVGLHTHASRWARRAPMDTLVFNFHAQFAAMAEAEKYGRMEQAVRQRDMALQGTLNPVLSRHGDDSQARQYSGRAVGAGWRCPFHAEAGQ